MAEITINFTLQGGGDGGNGTSNSQPNGATSKANAKTELTVSTALSIAKQFSSQIVDGYISSIGSRTGNYVMQEKAQNTLAVVGKVASIGAAFAANWVLGVVALVGEGINFGFQVAQQNRDVMWQNRNAEQLRRRAGYNSNYNR
ncbi:MAG: hypothetical protein J1G02_06370 [Clostridiales bacterium]|nr:hypothetical protein [Clostridiales bacterium]